MHLKLPRSHTYQRKDVCANISALYTRAVVKIHHRARGAEKNGFGGFIEMVWIQHDKASAQNGYLYVTPRI